MWKPLIRAHGTGLCRVTDPEFPLKAHVIPSFQAGNRSCSRNTSINSINNEMPALSTGFSGRETGQKCPEMLRKTAPSRIKMSTVCRIRGSGQRGRPAAVSCSSACHLSNEDSRKQEGSLVSSFLAGKKGVKHLIRLTVIKRPWETKSSSRWIQNRSFFQESISQNAAN